MVITALSTYKYMQQQQRMLKRLRATSTGNQQFALWQHLLQHRSVSRNYAVKHAWMYIFALVGMCVCLQKMLWQWRQQQLLPEAKLWWSAALGVDTGGVKSCGRNNCSWSRRCKFLCKKHCITSIYILVCISTSICKRIKNNLVFHQFWRFVIFFLISIDQFVWQL